VADTRQRKGAESTAENPAKAVPPASRFCRAAAPDGEISNETENAHSTGPVRELPTMQEKALISPLVPKALLPLRTA
jgi:hypothetical protein